jgi:hypothetical protein
MCAATELVGLRDSLLRRQARETEAIDGQVNALLKSIGQTLDRHTLPGQ